jgi:hypothetical protein
VLHVVSVAAGLACCVATVAVDSLQCSGFADDVADCVAAKVGAACLRVPI